MGVKIGPIEDVVSDWLGLGPSRSHSQPSERIAKRKKEITRLETKLETQVAALTRTAKKLSSARRSLRALQRSARKVRKVKP